MISKYKVYTILSDALREYDENFYCTTAYEPTPKDFPCLYFREYHYRPRRSMTLAYDDQVISSTVYIELFFNNPDETVDEVIALVERTMNGMYYIEEICNQIDNEDISIERYALRFYRKICEGDTL